MENINQFQSLYTWLDQDLRAKMFYNIPGGPLDNPLESYKINANSN